MSIAEIGAYAGLVVAISYALSFSVFAVLVVIYLYRH